MPPWDVSLRAWLITGNSPAGLTELLRSVSCSVEDC